MVTPTVSVRRMASTAGGMRRILKRKGPVVDYIRKAVDTGVYRSEEEIQKCKEERLDAEDLKSVMSRFRQDTIRGSNVHDYPLEYVILRQHPPIPDPPHMPVRLMRKLHQQEKDLQRKQHRPVEDLVRRYVDKFEQKSWNKSYSTEHREEIQNHFAKQTMSAEKYYERLLGVQAASSRINASNNLLPNMSAIVQQAYNAAIQHYRLQRSSKTMSDAECMDAVEDILRTQMQTEEEISSQQRKKASEYAASRKSTYSDTISLPGSTKDGMTQQDFGFLGNPSTLKGMMIWSDRLKAVPYEEWTIGASTALDHWLARQVLKISEETWQSCLEGLSTSPHHIAVGRDIIATREALFPETVPHSTNLVNQAQQKEDDDLETFREDEDDDEGERLNTAEVEKTIDELLASIGSLGTSSGRKAKMVERYTNEAVLTKHDLDDDALLQKLVSELQDWRRKVHDFKPKRPYETWPTRAQAAFDIWLERYVSTVLLAGSTNTTLSAIDLASTREALLAQPPLEKDVSDAFWGSLQEPQLARELAQRMKNNPDDARRQTLLNGVLAAANVWDALSEEEQIERLLNLGAIRPLLDEYISEKDRNEFLQRHGHQLLQGIPLEHLVSDPQGPITASDLPSDLVSKLSVKPSDRFSLQIKSYNSVAVQNTSSEEIVDGPGMDVILSADEKSRLLYMAWNDHKAGRARYEEKMFQTGRLGLRYSDPEHGIGRNEDDN